jgi:hypothetical protein
MVATGRSRTRGARVAVLLGASLPPHGTMLVTIIRATTRAMREVFVMPEPHSEGSNITKTVPSD